MSAKRTDANQREIVSALRDFGATVIDTHEVGHGYADINVGWRGRTYLMEIKCGGGHLTKDEWEFHGSWRGAPIYIVHTVQEALDILMEDKDDEPTR